VEVRSGEVAEGAAVRFTVGMRQSTARRVHRSALALLLAAFAAVGAGCGAAVVDGPEINHVVGRPASAAEASALAIVVDVLDTPSSGIELLDASRGIVVSQWRAVETVVDVQSGAFDANGGVTSAGYILYRVIARVARRNSGQLLVIVEGQVARYRPNYSSAFPLDGDDEPGWFRPRTERIRHQLRERFGADVQVVWDGTPYQVAQR
jgi:hypothetical protein